jgi:hypothetical protein
LQAYDKKEKKKKKEDKSKGGTLRSRHRIGVDFDKIYVFCGKCCVCIDKRVFIIVKIKCVNSNRISDICGKVNFTINYIHFITLDIHLIKIHTNITIFNIFGETIPQQDLRISLKVSPRKLKKIF